MESLSRLLEVLSGLLAGLGVPPEFRALGAMVLLYALGILAVLLVVVFLLRRRRRTEAPVSVPPVPEEGPGEPATKSVVEVEAAEEEAAEEEAGAPSAPSVRPTPPVVAPQLPTPEEPVPSAPPPASLFERMRAGLAKTQSALVGRIDTLLGGRQKVDADLLEELEEILITADFGMKTTQDLVQSLEKRCAGGNTVAEDLRNLLKEEIRLRLRLEAAPLDFSVSTPFVIMVVGVNGVGKTTTIGKLARQYAGQGKKVVLGAGDTFRAAAAEQLAIWGERAGVAVVRHAEGADPAAVAFDAARAAVARNADVLILDTAGRLHTKVNLMEELKKVRRVLAREIPGAPHETLLVLDATTGQNALVQARLFREVVEVSGIALTKLDGTAKGGVVVAIGAELGLPVRFVGIGEGVDDLRPFDTDLFVEALFQKNV
jgi:fused signal recognition particle receptor